MQIRRKHSMDKDEAKALVEGIADDLNQSLRLERNWQDYDLNVRGSGVNGKITVADDFIEVNIKLGFALKLLEPTIRKEVEIAMDKHLKQ